MRKTALLLIGLAFASMPAGAYAKEKKEKAISPETVFYGDGSSEYAVLYRGGPAPSVHPTVLLLHENGASTKSVNPYALSLQSEGFTVLALEWGKIAEKYGARIWEPLTNEIKSAIAYFQEPVRAAELGVIPDRIAMVGGSRGANLSLLTSLKANLAVPGTIKAVASLSGDPNIRAQIERNLLLLEEEPTAANRKAVNKISKTYGCQKNLTGCPVCLEDEPECVRPKYIEEWSAYQLVTELGAGPTAAPTLLFASAEEHSTSDSEDQAPLAAALNVGKAGSPSQAVILAGKAHGFAYWGQAKPRIVEFLNEHDRS